MRITPVAAAAILLVAAAPAAATQSRRCAPVSGAGPLLSLTIGRGAGQAIVGATLSEGGRLRSTAGPNPALAVGQSWIDSQRIWLDLTDANAMRYEAKLRASFNPKLRGRPATGTLVRNGRSHRIRCVEA